MELFYVEFFNQGDMKKENGLPSTNLCDRTNTNMHKSQVGFIKFVIMPQFLIISYIEPEIQPYLGNLQINLKYYETKVAEEEKSQTQI